MTGRNLPERTARRIDKSPDDPIIAFAQANWRQNAVPCLAKRSPSP
ncbi:hypothetical protein SPHV1_330068 [Novosphingobium sp. KN65.2]|nr:hypothetical protein SPHV1_330068 [Novosphingobium sp. KN65.2]